MADVAISPGNYELQSLSTMEAMATGLPIIAVRALALPELVHEGENGFLFEPGNSEQVTECLKKLISDDALREAMGRESLKIIQKHDIEKTLDTFEDVYKKAIIKNK